jgi:aspartyl-tRNA(Asn)/glutamyl-tRNA(Gln) amidotransferase subunit B
LNIINQINQEWDIVIGLEVHVQLQTRRKIFGHSKYIYNSPPNSLVCPPSFGLPGSLPTINQKAIQDAIKFGLTVQGEINQNLIFSRKHYFYPDLAKGYQISQFTEPIISGGYVPIWWEDKLMNIYLQRAHLEEDTAKSTHINKDSFSLIDFNRSGASLIEIVTNPCIRHPEQAKLFVQRIRQIVNFLDISNGKMEEGNLRCDANISLKKKNSQNLGIKTEIKNINSFRNVQKSLESEIIRQHKILCNGKKVKQVTLTWNSSKNVAEIMREKEDSHDYRYFPDPDLPPVIIDSKFINSIAKDMIKTPMELEVAWKKNYKFSTEDVTMLTSSKLVSEYFQLLLDEGVNPGDGLKWISGEIFRLFNEVNIEFDNRISPKDLKRIILLVSENKITNNDAKEILKCLFDSNSELNEILEKGSYYINKNKDLTLEAINLVFNQFPQELDRLKSGEDKLYGFFVGMTVKSSKEKLDPKIILQEIKKIIED